jgi:phospholipid/cholesterol/gamma-HCH transport system substrate-binding protein
MNRQMRVGIFVLVGLALCAVAVFLIGDSQQLWQPKVQYRAAFNDVAGLKPGAPVRMGGLDIGNVTSVGHGDNPGDPRIYVTLSITKAEAQRVRQDTVARVANKGLLGDKMIELSAGAGGAAAQDPKQLVRSEEPQDMFAAANQLASETQHIVEKMQPLAQSLGDPKFAEDIKQTMSDMRRIADALATNDSIAHKFLYDPEEGRKFSAMLTNMNNASSRLDGLLADARDVTEHVKNGPGIAHAVIYDGDMSQNAAGALAEVHKDLKAIREGNGLAHAVLYGDDSSQHVMANLNAMTDDLRVIVSNVKSGKGTIGALLVDPSIYEDLKSAIGNVERNQVLRALVRYSIKADEQKPPPQVHGTGQPQPQK